MHKLWASTYKEFLLLVRDFGGLAILFLMPLLLVITITLVQNDTFKTLKETKIPILLVDNDQGEVSKNIQENLKNSPLFEVQIQSSEGSVKELVQTGK
ncbi:MAG TPA: ABC transporter permease, partial [Pricia sp.]|nr:ABC transporter permease [Pricia sp.]